MMEQKENQGLLNKDYLGADGLLYCGECQEAKEAFYPAGMEWLERKNIRGCVLVTEKNVNRKKSGYGIRNMNCLWNG